MVTEKLPKRVHIIGICGVATSAIAIAFQKKGCQVTGSDKGFYPPVSTYLKEAGVSYYAGWHPEKIAESGKPDFIMVGGSGTSSSNPEFIYAEENKIPVYSYPEVIKKYFIRKNSIVTAGTWGKTTTSSLLSFILTAAGMKPSYFTGGLSLSHPTGALSDSEWSVVEGDEYQTTISDKQPKFAYYSPTHLLLTSVSWDHADLYPTEKDYFDAFDKLVRSIPDNGIIVACGDEPGAKKTLSSTKKKAVIYGTSSDANYRYHSITHTNKGLEFVIDHGLAEFTITSPMLGRFNTENIAGCFAMAHQIGIQPQIIIDAIRNFKGIKRRLEKRFEGDVTVLDCHAPTPEKAASVLESIREIYDKKIIAVYEPNIGGRQRSSKQMYDQAFKNADKVIVPNLTKLKVDESASERPIEGQELSEIISGTHSGTHFIENDSKVVDFLISNAKRGDVIVFLGSHGFRGMIEETVSKSK